MCCKKALRCGIGVEQDVAVLEILWIWAMLEMLLQRVSAFNWGDGAFIDLEIGCGLVRDKGCHVEDGGSIMDGVGESFWEVDWCRTEARSRLFQGMSWDVVNRPKLTWHMPLSSTMSVAALGASPPRVSLQAPIS
jgi:hypothetical protein